MQKTMSSREEKFEDVAKTMPVMKNTQKLVFLPKGRQKRSSRITVHPTDLLWPLSSVLSVTQRTAAWAYPLKEHCHE
jgi:hypothetical protein